MNALRKRAIPRLTRWGTIAGQEDGLSGRCVDRSFRIEIKPSRPHGCPAAELPLQKNRKDMEPISSRMLERFQTAWSPTLWNEFGTLVAVSGGADSTALLRLMVETQHDYARAHTNVPIVVAHYDHAWREDSRQDATFVHQLAQRLGLQCILERREPETDSATCEGQSEERARQMRYAFLERAAKQVGARYIAVAHTADDQIETMLHNAIRGTGLRGLGGMRRIRSVDEAVTVVRPLLAFRRSELVEYLHALGQTYRVDPSNVDSQYTRVRIRNELLPSLRTYNASVDQALSRLAKLAHEAQDEIVTAAEGLLAKATLSRTQQTVVLLEEPFRLASSFLTREAMIVLWTRARWPMQSFGYDHWSALAAWIRDSSDVAMTLPGGVDVRRVDGAWNGQRSQGGRIRFSLQD